MSAELEKLLESVARDVAKDLADGLNSGESGYTDVGAILKRRLLPLLLAGQAMRDAAENRYAGERFLLERAYDAAKQKALEPAAGSTDAVATQDARTEVVDKDFHA